MWGVYVCVKNISGGRQGLFFRGKGGADLDSRDMDEVKRFCQRRLPEATSRERSAGVGVVQARAAPAGKRSLGLPHRKVELQTARSQVVAGIGGAAGGGPWGAVCAWANVAEKPEGKRGGGPSLGAGPGRAKGPAAPALAAPRARGGGRRLPRPPLPPASAPRQEAAPPATGCGGGGPPPRSGVSRGGPGGRRSRCAHAAPGPEGEEGPSRAPRSRRRSPSAGCRRASLAPGRAGAGELPDAVGRCSGETPADPSPAPPETRGGRGGGGGVWRGGGLHLLRHFNAKPAGQREMQTAAWLPGRRHLGQREQPGGRGSPFPPR